MFFCGIDVAKHQHAALVLDDGGQVVQPAFSFANSRAGFDQLAAALTELSEPVSIGLEATGHYWLALYADLTQQFPGTLSGRVNTGLNLLVFVAAFAAQWGIGAVITLWPPGPAGGYAAAGYQAGFGMMLGLQLLALAWFGWAGRRRPKPV